MALRPNVWCVVILASLTVAQPTKTKVSWKFESAMEQMRSDCVQGKDDSALACFKYKVFSAIDELFKNDSLEVSKHLPCPCLHTVQGSHRIWKPYIGPLSHGTLQRHRWLTTPFFKDHGSVHRNNILIYIQQDAKLHSSFYLETALHVSGATTHHQERKQLYLQHLVFVTPLLLPAVIVEELEMQSISTNHQERKQLYLQHLVFVTPLLLPAAIVEGLELLCISNSSTIAAGISNGVTNTRCRRYSCLRSRRWVVVPPATCRGVSR